MPSSHKAISDFKDFFSFTVEKENISILHCVAFIVILAASLYIRLLFISQPPRWDESYTYLIYSKESLGHVVSYFNSTNNHILNSILVHFSTVLFGDSIEAIRIPVLVLGVLTVPLGYAVALKTYNRHAALFAAAFLSSSSALVEYSTNARGYIYVIDLMLVSFLIAYYLREKDSMTLWILLAVVAALGFYAMPIMFFAFGAVAFWMLLTAMAGDVKWQGRRFVIRLALSCCLGAFLTLLLYSPVFFSEHMESSIFVNPDVHPKSLSFVTEHLYKPLVDAMLLWFRGYNVFFLVVLLTSCGFSLLLNDRVSRHAVPLHIATIIWSLLAVALQRVVPYPRVWLFLLPLMLITASGFLGYLARMIPPRALTPVLATAICLWLCHDVATNDLILKSTQTGVMPDSHEVAGAMMEEIGPDECIAAPESGWPILQYRYLRSGRSIDLDQSCPDVADHIWLVTNGIHAEPVSLVFGYRFPTGDLDSYDVTLVRTFSRDSRLYRLDRKQ